MSKVYMIGDLHFGHHNIHRLRPAPEWYDGLPSTEQYVSPSGAKFGNPLSNAFESEEAHRMFLINIWNNVVSKRDRVYVLGDAAFTPEGLESIGDLNGSKVLVAGNHDDLKAKEYLKYFDDMRGALKYKRCWLTHIPIHPSQMYRAVANIHGHVHEGGPDGKHYYNVCLENIGYQPKLFTEIMEELAQRPDDE